MGVTNYIWDVVSDNVLMESDENDEVIATYEHEPTFHGELNSMTRDGQSYYPHYDGEGNTVAVTDENQNVVEEASYSAFGKVVEKTSSIVNPFGYKGALGYYTDSETGNLDIRRRTYEPQIGRWLSIDPSHFVDGPNEYSYCRNNPISRVDPSGLASCACEATIQYKKSSTLGKLTTDDDGRTYWGCTFEVHVDFTGECGCCSFRQEVKGLGSRARILPNGSWVYEKTKSESSWGLQIPNQNAWEEDCTGMVWVEDPDTFPVPVPDCYGYRGGPNEEGDRYSQPDALTGCAYDSYDTPGLYVNEMRRLTPNSRLEFQTILNFRFRVWDFCRLDDQGNPKKVAEEIVGYKCERKFPPFNS